MRSEQSDGHLKQYMERALLHFFNGTLLNVLSDESYLKMRFNATFGYPLDLNNPNAFNEKLQWLKLHDRKSVYSTIVDKYEVKNYIANCIGADFIIPTLGVWDKFDDIDFNNLPNQFVLKCTHDSAGIVICKDKSKLDIDAARGEINKCLNRSFYWLGREWPYKNVQPRIIAEKYMEDYSIHELRDYKFFCFDGQVKCFKVDFNRFVDHHANYFDKNGNILNIGEIICPPDFKRKIEMPPRLKEMIGIAEKLADNIPFVRVDLYNVNGNIYFGEMTFFPASGFGKFISKENDYELGSFIKLPTTN